MRLMSFSFVDYCSRPVGIRLNDLPVFILREELGKVTSDTVRLSNEDSEWRETCVIEAREVLWDLPQGVYQIPISAIRI